MSAATPARSYLIWFSQRVGSTLLTQALEDTGIAGRPREWLNDDDLLARYAARDALALRDALWERAATANGVVGVKYGMHPPLHRRLTAIFTGALGGEPDPDGRKAWEAFFPRCRHVFITRRNRLRLAVSWWRAIQSEEWHRPSRPEPTVVDGPAGRAPPPQPPPDLEGRYDYDAIEHLLLEADHREAAIQEQLDRWGVVPHAIVYEELIARYEATVRGLLDYLEIPNREEASIPAPAFARVADAISESWYQRFRRERAERTDPPRSC